MFKRIVLTAALLAGCGSKTTTEPRIVVMPQASPTLNKIKRDDNCEWKNKSFRVFGQKAQRLSFDFTECGEKSSVKLRLKDGNKIVLKAGDDLTFTYPIVEIEKLGADTPQGFLERKILRSLSNPNLCDIIEVEPYIWRIVSRWKPDYKKMEDWNSDANPCGRRSSQEYVRLLPNAPVEYGMGNIYVIKEGAVITINDLAGLNIKLDSITYENRG